MKKKSIIAILVLLIGLSISSTFAYWVDEIAGVNSSYNTQTKVGEFLMFPPTGIKEYEKGVAYKEGEYILKDGKLFLLTNDCIVGDQKGWLSCDFDAIDDPWNSPFKSLSKEWEKTTRYVNGDYVLYQDVIYRVFRGQIVNDNVDGGPAAKGEGWVRIGNLEYDMNFDYPIDSYVIKDGILYRSTKELHGSTPFDETSFMRYGEYNTTQQYQLKDAVFYNDKVYVVRDAKLANTHLPDTLDSGWFRIDTLEWQENMSYEPGDLVKYGSEYYFAHTGSTNQRPDIAVGVWSYFDNFKYNDKMVYKQGDVTIDAGALYKSLSTGFGNRPSREEGSIRQWQAILEKN